MYQKKIGEYITVSIGIGPNRFLAKTASNLQKPNGLNEININNYLSVYEKLKLTDLCGIAERNSLRLKNHGINTVVDFYNADIPKLKRVFASINGYYWYLRLHGWEADETESTRQSFGNSYAIPNRLASITDIAPILYKLVVKTGKRLRMAKYKATGIHLALTYCDGTYWHKGHLVETAGTTLYDSQDIYKEAFKLLCEAPCSKPVAIIAESCYGLIKSNQDQLNMFYDTQRKDKLVESVDKITDKWGEFTIVPAAMVNIKQHVHDRIAFGGI